MGTYEKIVAALHQLDNIARKSPWEFAVDVPATVHDCTAEYLRQEVLRAAIRRPEPRYRAPHDLRARVIASIQSQTDVLCRAPW
jgi:hypothetical protein